MDTDINKLKKKIKHLLDLAANAGTKEEAATAAGMAERLAEKHRLNIAELEITGEIDAEDVTGDSLYSENSTSKWKSKLANALCIFNGCKAIYISKSDLRTFRKKGGQINIFGRPSDIEIVKYLYAYLSVEIERLAKTNTKRQNLSRGEAKGYSNAYKMGAVEGVYIQLKEAQQEARKEATSTALAVVDKRANDAEQYMKTIHKNVVKAPHARFTNVKGFLDGKEAGKNIHLGKSIGGDTKALPE